MSTPTRKEMNPFALFTIGAFIIWLVSLSIDISDLIQIALGMLFVLFLGLQVGYDIGTRVVLRALAMGKATLHDNPTNARKEQL